MGREATGTKRQVLATVSECIDLVNGTLQRVETVEANHNGMAAKLDSELTALAGQIVVASSSASRAEAEASAVRTLISDETTNRLKLAQEQRTYVDRADTAIRGEVTALIDAERSERISDDDVQSVAFELFRSMSFGQRARWFFFGVSTRATARSAEVGRFTSQARP